jgi:tRNA(fMet)-specific endonuclease VapC
VNEEIYLLDTNIISSLLRRERFVEQRIEKALAANATIVLSPVAFYETKRGLLKRDAKKHMAFFERLIPKLAWCDIERADWEEAARLWAEREKSGAPIEDADLLIAVLAKRLGAILVTDNEKDFEYLGVRVENWRRK